ncbi:hypothetical protein Hanom_Chr12g01164851 [Helianthus anomalus]
MYFKENSSHGQKAVESVAYINNQSKMPFSSLRFDQFCDFRPKVCFSASRSKGFEILPFPSSSLTPFIFLRKVRGISVFFVNLKSNSVFSGVFNLFT